MNPFHHSRRVPARAEAGGVASSRPGFEYLSDDQVYLDSACQTLRPQPVIDALNDYYLHYNACGERVKYEWGRKVDAAVAETRSRVLRALGLPVKHYVACFTLNTTYGLNLLLGQLPSRYARVITTHTEHNSVFLSTMTCARRLDVPRVLLQHAADGSIDYADADLRDALVVVSAMNNFDGTATAGLGALIEDAHRAGATVIVDAAQAAPHGLSGLRGLRPDAFCLSAHKLYGASLGVVAATDTLLDSLEVSFLGGGQVVDVTADAYELLPELETRLEAGLQPWGEIIALGAALKWLDDFESVTGQSLEGHEAALASRLYEGLAELPNLTVVGDRPASVMSVIPQRLDGHQLAAFLSKAGVMVRSGYFCAHHWLLETNHYDPLVRFSLGAHNTEADVDRALEIMGRLMRGI